MLVVDLSLQRSYCVVMQKIQEMMTFNYYDYKRKHFEAKDIMDKEKTLRHMLKLNTWKQIKDMILDEVSRCTMFLE